MLAALRCETRNIGGRQGRLRGCQASLVLPTGPCQVILLVLLSLALHRPASGFHVCHFRLGAGQQRLGRPGVCAVEEQARTGGGGGGRGVAGVGGGRGLWKRGSATTQLRACSKGSMEGGLLSALRVSTAKNTRWLVAGSAAAVLLWRRDAVAISCIAGAIGNAIISKILKRILNQERPEGATVSDPGMPSSHAMSLFFFASYLSSSFIFWATWPSPGFRAASVAALAAFAVNSAAWRVTAGLHTREQVLVGSIIGSVDGIAWFWATDYRWDLIEALDRSLVSSSFAAPAICGALVLGAVVVGSVERKAKKWLKRVRGDKG